MTVAVVGAGLAGLACASTLAENGCTVEVFEAAERIGGRVLSMPDPAGAAWELGAQVIHPGGAQVLDPAHDLGAAPPERTDFAIVMDGRPIRSWQLMARGIRPWEAAASFTAAGTGSVAQWLRSAAAPDPAARYTHDWVEQEWACDAESLDVVQAARWVSDRSGSDGADLVVPAGLGSLVQRLSTGLTIRRAQPVDEVVVGRTGTEICTGGACVAADAVVVTVPPWLLRPPGGRDGLVLRGVDPAVLHEASRLPGGDAVAVVITCRQPASESLTAFDRGLGFIRCRKGSRHVQAVSKGPAAAVLRAALGDPRALATALYAALSVADRGDPVDFEVADWGRRIWTRGAFSAPTAGHRASRVALRAMQGRGLLFAGEATRTGGSAARMHGAVLSGIDAAHRVLKRLDDGCAPHETGDCAAHLTGTAAGGITPGGAR